jgi:hypothetical protein
MVFNAILHKTSPQILLEKNAAPLRGLLNCKYRAKIRKGAKSRISAAFGGKTARSGGEILCNIAQSRQLNIQKTAFKGLFQP